MDTRKDPYVPGAGTKPPALVGGDAQLESFDILLERLEPPSLSSPGTCCAAMPGFWMHVVDGVLRVASTVGDRRSAL